MNYKDMIEEIKPYLEECYSKVDYEMDVLDKAGRRLDIKDTAILWNNFSLDGRRLIFVTDNYQSISMDFRYSDGSVFSDWANYPKNQLIRYMVQKAAYINCEFLIPYMIIHKEFLNVREYYNYFKLFI
jgi:hypothetical protein